MNRDGFLEKPLIGILRGIDAASLEPLIEVVIRSGLETLEITMNTPCAAELIARARELAGDRLSIGAGTVLDRDSLDSALAAGAGFIVMPTLVEEVASSCRERDIPFFPGALTPQEIHRAWLAGACMVKVFPARVFGPEYFREIKGPFDSIRLLACGGVSADSIGEYARCGADGFAFGGSLFDPSWIAAGRFEQVEAGLKELLAAWADSNR